VKTREVGLLAAARSRMLAALDKDSQRRFETVVNNLKQYGVPERPPSR
jgi:hypothetical protein